MGRGVMGGSYHPGPSPFDQSHPVRLYGSHSHYGTFFDHLAHADGANVRNPRPWHRSIAEYDYHVCRVNRYGEVWDYFGGELWLVGKSHSDREAVEMWRLFLCENWRMSVDSTDVRDLT